MSVTLRVCDAVRTCERDLDIDAVLSWLKLLVWLCVTAPLHVPVDEGVVVPLAVKA